jgi:hypothetical protein
MLARDPSRRNFSGVGPSFCWDDNTFWLEGAVVKVSQIGSHGIFRRLNHARSRSATIQRGVSWKTSDLKPKNDLDRVQHRREPPEMSWQQHRERGNTPHRRKPENPHRPFPRGLELLDRAPSHSVTPPEGGAHSSGVKGGSAYGSNPRSRHRPRWISGGMGPALRRDDNKGG